jgi:nucleotide-binding universal stress UspA family protein
VRSEGLIVVGVDGSESAQAALEFALEEAARWSAHVHAVTAFHSPEYWPVVYGMAGGMVVPPTMAELADDAERTARQALTDATGSVGPAARTVPVDVRVVPGSAGQVLLDQAAEADLLVVGHRGRGGIASACLGSVGLQCVLHAACPVVVVRPTSAPAARAEVAAVPAAARA